MAVRTSLCYLLSEATSICLGGSDGSA